jgi:uncharacterized protein
MKYFILCFSLFFIFLNPAVCQNKKKDIQKLIELTGSDKTVDEGLKNIMPILFKQAGLNNVDNSTKERFKEFEKAMEQEIKKMMKKVKENEMVALYDEHYTHSEIKELIAFYETPIGQKLLKKAPVFQAELMSTISTKYLPEFKDKALKTLKVN